MPVTPQNAAGWRIEPPVSVAVATGARRAATAAAEPLELPPGVRSGSQGFFVAPFAECSPEEPMANSSILVRPRVNIPASRNRRTTVES